MTKSHASAGALIVGCMLTTPVWAQESVESTQTATVRGRAPTAAITLGNDSVSTQLPPKVGHVVRVTATTSDPDGDPITGVTYRWMRGAAKVQVGTGATYATAAADVGQPMAVEAIVATDAAVTDPASGTITESFDVLANAAPVATGVSITGEPRVGVMLSGSYIYNDADGDPEGTSTFQWYRADDAAGTVNRTAIGGATTSTYEIVPADVTKYLVFEVTPVASTGAPDTGMPISATSSEVPGAAPTAAPVAEIPLLAGNTPTFVGAAANGTVNYSDADGDPPGTHTYQWYRADDALGTNRIPIGGATGLTYTIANADVGRNLVFEVTPRSTSGTPDIGPPVSTVSRSVPVSAPGGRVNAGEKKQFPIVVTRAGTVNGYIYAAYGLTRTCLNGVNGNCTTTLITPDGSRYSLQKPGGIGDIYSERLISNVPASGTWIIEIDNTLNTDPMRYIDVVYVRMDFR